jgi:metallo-beta-lactamase class B
MARIGPRLAGVLAGALVAAGAAAAPVPAKRYAPPGHDLPPRVQQHIDLAYLAMNGDVSPAHITSLLFSIAPDVYPDQLAAARKNPPLPATQAFDQLYYLGIAGVSAWALNTSDGIILIDTLDNPDEARTYIEGGLRSVGLDPARIKYILITHGHADHYGGARYLQEKYHARVLMSPQDWDFIARSPPRPGAAPLPTRDIEIADGQKLTLGRTSLSLYITPGHTPGAVSSIFNVTDQGKPHVVSFFGGTGLQTIDRDPKKGGFATMRNSAVRFAKLSVDAGADAIVSNHPFTDDAWNKARRVRERKARGPSPWVVGKDATLRFYVAMAEAVNAVEAFYEAPSAGR